MIINLKQLRTLDTDNIKLDKINYNFDQLIVNGGGHKGPIGPDGNTGPQGFQGALGFQGDRGFQGTQGPDSESILSYWDVVPQNLGLENNNTATIFARHPISATPPDYATVVGSGYITGESGYAALPTTSGLPNYQWIINRKEANVASNLRLTSGDVLNNAFDITMDINNSTPITGSKLFLSFINSINSQLNLQAQEHIIRSNINGSNILKVSDTGGEINVDSVFEAHVTFNQKLSIENSGADTNKVAVAVDTTGLIEFKTTSELGGSVKTGTIISILPSIFSDSNKFICNQTIDTGSDPDNPIQIRMGAGIGDYVGWYLCNGQEWTNGGSITIEVPDLNSFSYQIIANPISNDPNSQGYIGVTNNEINLIGGADISVEANEIGTSSASYNIELTNDSDDPEISTNSSGNQFKIKKLPQIIYLGADNLYWSQLGTGQLAQADYSSTDYDPVDYNAF